MPFSSGVPYLVSASVQSLHLWSPGPLLSVHLQSPSAYVRTRGIALSSSSTSTTQSGNVTSGAQSASEPVGAEPGANPTPLSLHSALGEAG